MNAAFCFIGPFSAWFQVPPAEETVPALVWVTTMRKIRLAKDVVPRTPPESRSATIQSEKNVDV